jgi:hypothetical protein
MKWDEMKWEFAALLCNVGKETKKLKMRFLYVIASSYFTIGTGNKRSQVDCELRIFVVEVKEHQLYLK